MIPRRFMLAVIIRLSVLWYLLLPLAAAGALWARYQPMRRAARLGLVQPWALRQLRLALACCGGFLLLTSASIFYETLLWPPAVAAALALAMALLLRSAATGVHPGLRGFHWPMPADGLAVVERERRLDRPLLAWHWWVWRLAPLIPMLALILLAAGLSGRRWLVWLAVAGGLWAPGLLVASRRAWFSPLALLLVSGFLGWHAAGLGARLPPGRWFTPWTGARCSAQVAVTSDGTAWCVNQRSGAVYHYRLPTGLVLEQYQVAAGWQVFAANATGAWIKQIPSSRLVYLGSAPPQSSEFFYPSNGAAAEDNVLWLVDGMGRLIANTADAQPDFLAARGDVFRSPAIVVEVLPDQSVWVGGFVGAARLDAASGDWQAYGQQAGLRGPVIDIAAGRDGTVWLLHTEVFDALRTNWWMSASGPDGHWLHVNVGQLTGLDAPRSRDAMAVDGTGRVWFTALASARREKFLGVLNPDGTLAHPPFSLGRFASGDLYGVLGDGRGGIYLYNGASEPLRHWRP